MTQPKKAIKPRRSAKTVTTKSLVKKALKNGFNMKPSKGKQFLETLEVGSFFDTGSCRGILIDLSPSAARVLIVDVDIREDDMNYYIGKQSIAPKTEVERI